MVWELHGRQRFHRIDEGEVQRTLGPQIRLRDGSPPVQSVQPDES
jgi:hypothetical protein